MSQGE
ncbi:UNVERIFIED_CONTAM: hypothetical protein GTU68_064572 [Idotea baltica]